jgi:hypothetical protein
MKVYFQRFLFTTRCSDRLSEYLKRLGSNHIRKTVFHKNVKKEFWKPLQVT